MDKRFHKSDAILYQFNTIEYPFDVKNPILKRHLVKVYASKNVTWKDIVDEIHQYRKNPVLQPGKILLTCMVDYPDFVVAFTLIGAVDIIRGLTDSHPHKELPKEYLYFDVVDSFAKEMVATRDLAEYEQSCKEHGLTPFKNFKDFWPE